MRIAAWAVLGAICTWPTAAQAQALAAVPTGVVTGFVNAESAVWDPASGHWYVSDYADGKIARLAPGATSFETFATGFASPAGITIVGDTMYVADGYEIRLIAMADPTDQLVLAPDLDDRTFFVDVAVDEATGDVYASATGESEIWRFARHVDEETQVVTYEPKVLVSTPSPHGIYLHGGTLYVARYSFLTSPGGIYRVDLDTLAVTPVVEIEGTSLHGLARDGDGWLTTDSLRGQVLRVAEDGVYRVLLQLTPYVADLGVDPATRTVAIPNKVSGYVTFALLVP